MIVRYHEAAQEGLLHVIDYLEKFPHSLIYAIEGNDLLILAVAHHSLRPGYWMGRP